MDLQNLELLADIAFPAKGVRAIMIQNSAGGWTDANGSSRELSNADDLKWMIAHRYVADAVLVGSATAIKENYSKISSSDQIQSWRIDHNLRPEIKLITTTSNPEKLDALLAISDLVVIPSSLSQTSSSPKLVVAGETMINWKIAFEKLNEVGLNRISCEGGPNLVESLLKEDLVDQFVLTRSPIAGPENAFTSISEYIRDNEKRVLFESDGFTFLHVGKLPTWEELLTVGEFFVLRDAGTQAPFSVDYEKKPAAGYYTCRSCGARLFDATDQFDARCGWPAFWKPNDNANLILEDDNSKGYMRVEVKCGSCDSHLGHVFHGEGFGFPTDDRYCINAICLVRKYD